MFQDLDATLAELLRAELPGNMATIVTTSFSTPDQTFPPSWVPLPTLNFFLFKALPDWENRDNEPHLTRREDGVVVRTPAPTRIRCHYLVTAWAKAGVHHPEQDEHRLLGEAMRILLRHREIPTQALCGELKSQTTPVRGIVRADSAVSFEAWQALGSRPRATFEYSVTYGMEIHPAEFEGKMVGVA